MGGGASAPAVRGFLLEDRAVVLEPIEFAVPITPDTHGDRICAGSRNLRPGKKGVITTQSLCSMVGGHRLDTKCRQEPSCRRCVASQTE